MAGKNAGRSNLEPSNLQLQTVTGVTDVFAIFETMCSKSVK
jgi:hypothetical protein